MIGCHAERGVALDVFDRAIAFAFGEGDVANCDIILEIDEGFVFGVFDAPEGNDVIAGVGDGRNVWDFGWIACSGCGACTPACAIRQATGQCEIPSGGPNDGHALRYVAGYEGRQRVIPFRFSVEMG